MDNQETPFPVLNNNASSESQPLDEFLPNTREQQRHLINRKLRFAEMLQKVKERSSTLKNS